MTYPLELFAEAGGPPGFSYRAEFMSPDEERALIGTIETLPLKEARYKDYTAKRRSVTYGSSYDFSQNARGDAPPVADFLLPLQAKVAGWIGVRPEQLGHVLVAEYRPGTQLGWHRDVPDYELVCGVSLATACRMRFRPFPPRGNRKDVLALELAPRSAYVLRGDARWRWQHSIAPTPGLRYSITFRTLAA